MPPKQLEFGNFTCLFGQYKLLDFADEIVFPAFEDTRHRPAGGDKYFVDGVEKLTFDTPEGRIYCIAGRYIKDTVLRQTQEYVEGTGLQARTGSLKNSPSSLFVLILNNHKLLYLRETPHAPSMQSFETHMSLSLRRAHSRYLLPLLKMLGYYKKDRSYPERNKIKEDIYQKIPVPKLEIRPLASEQTLNDFISSNFQVVNTVEVKFLPTNDEINPGGFFKQAEDTNQSIGSKEVTIRYHNPEGVNKGKTSDLLSAIVSRGIHSIRLTGKNQDGLKVSGNGENFKLSVPLVFVPDEVVSAVGDLYNEFIDRVHRNILKTPVNTENESLKKVKGLTDFKEIDG